MDFGLKLDLAACSCPKKILAWVREQATTRVVSIKKAALKRFIINSGVITMGLPVNITGATICETKIQ